jgi:hypothetical protein
MLLFLLVEVRAFAAASAAAFARFRFSFWELARLATLPLLLPWWLWWYSGNSTA